MTEQLVNGKYVPVVSDVMQNKTSSRTLPLIRLNLRLLAEMVGILPRADCLRPAGRRPVLIRTIFAAKKGTSLSRCLLLAEMVGFEPTCPIKDKTISSRSRYDHFDTSPYS